MRGWQVQFYSMIIFEHHVIERRSGKESKRREGTTGEGTRGTTEERRRGEEREEEGEN